MYKLIIVDDEQDLREGLVLGYPWGIMGYEIVASFGNGKDAFDYMERFKVDVVLSDVRMPKMDGLELCSAIRGANLKTMIVLLSGYSEFEYARTAIRYQVSDYLLKPAGYDQVVGLFTKIKEELDVINGVSEIENKPIGYYNQIVNQVLLYIDSNYADANLEDASLEVALSPNYLSRIFKRKTNKNFSEYLLDVKMSKATELLTDISLKTYEVATLVGYENPKNFTRAFKAYYGQTPREYREGSDK